MVVLLVKMIAAVVPHWIVDYYQRNLLQNHVKKWTKFNQYSPKWCCKQIINDSVYICLKTQLLRQRKKICDNSRCPNNEADVYPKIFPLKRIGWNLDIQNLQKQ